MPSDMTVLSPVANPLPDPQPELRKKSVKHAAVAIKISASTHNTTFLAFIVFSPFVVSSPCLASISIPTMSHCTPRAFPLDDLVSLQSVSPKGVAIPFLRINHIPRHVS